MTKHYEAEELKGMTKNDLVEIIMTQQTALEQKSGSGRKEEVLKVLQEQGPISILGIAELLNISTKNVSSQLTYLRRAGHRIATKSDGRKFIEVEED
jgi:predicted ArsR family transcriptional regulator